MIREFNDKMGNRRRPCQYCLVYDRKAYTRREAEENKLAVFERLSNIRNGIWSNSDWRVTTNTAKLVVVMSPFDGWTDSYEDCIEHVLDNYSNSSYGVSREDAAIALEFLFPKLVERLTQYAKAKEALL